MIMDDELPQARWREDSPNRMSLERQSTLTDRTQRSANAFRFGLRGVDDDLALRGHRDAAYRRF